MVEKYKAYPEYKDSGVKWLGKIPSNWSVIPLKRYFSIINGSTPKSGNDNFWNGDIIWITPSDLSKLTSFDIINSTRKITKSGLASCGTSIVPINSIILSCRAPIGSIGLAKVELCTNQGCKSLVPFQDSSSYFYAYVLSICTEELNAKGKGTTFLELSNDELGYFSLPKPTIKEQRNIVIFLDYETYKIDTLIKQQQQLIKLLEEKRQAVISHTVTKGLNPNVSMKDSGVEWLGEIPEHWLSVGFKKYLNPIVDYRGKTPEKVEDGIFLVTARNIKEGKINYSLSHEFIKEVDYKDIMRRGIPKIGDVIFTTEAPLGEVANIDNENIALAQRIIKFRGKDQIVDNYYLKYFIMSDQFQQGLNTYATGSTAQGIKAERLGYLSLLIPPYKEQSNIVNYLDLEILKLNQLMVKANQVIELLKERRTALISAAVTGKIDVRDWQAPTITV